MEYQYRTGTLADLKKLRQLGVDSYSQFKDVLNVENWNKLNTSLSSESFYTELLTISTCFVCETDEQIVGMAYLIPKGNPTELFDKDWSYIRMVGVHTDHTGKGIGKKLTQMCISHAKETGEKIIALHTSEFMDAARHIYENLGFKKTKELAPRLGKKYWLYQLEL
jgi:ribosomal protein S18 acetylase RimI-like enzyme